MELWFWLQLCQSCIYLHNYVFFIQKCTFFSINLVWYCQLTSICLHLQIILLSSSARSSLNSTYVNVNACKSFKPQRGPWHLEKGYVFAYCLAHLYQPPITNFYCKAEPPVFWAWNWRTQNKNWFRFRIMTTWKQPEYERVMEELRRAEDKERAGRKKETMVTKTMTSDPDFLTEKEMNSVSSVYRTHGTSTEEGTILPRDLPQASAVTNSKIPKKFKYTECRVCTSDRIYAKRPYTDLLSSTKLYLAFVLC